MKAWTAAAFTLVGAFIALHAWVIARVVSNDDLPLVIILLFTWGIPLALAVTVVSIVALKKTRARRFRYSLAVGLLPFVAWPLLYLLEIGGVLP